VTTDPAELLTPVGQELLARLAVEHREMWGQVEFAAESATDQLKSRARLTAQESPDAQGFLIRIPSDAVTDAWPAPA
jgi:hypothetical protein